MTHDEAIESAVVPLSSWCGAEEPCCCFPAPAAGICVGISRVLNELLLLELPPRSWPRTLGDDGLYLSS